MLSSSSSLSTLLSSSSTKNEWHRFKKVEVERKKYHNDTKERKKERVKVERKSTSKGDMLKRKKEIEKMKKVLRVQRRKKEKVLSKEVQ